MNHIPTFQDALNASRGLGQRHLLLGNGFSIACFRDIFAYDSLLEKTEFPEGSRLPSVFGALDTKDFELVMRRLEETQDLLSIYGLDRAPFRPSPLLKRDKEALRNTLISTIVRNHPDSPDGLGKQQYESCQAFLEYFLLGGGNIFTLNYDLLLYWTLMRPPKGPMGRDGFLRDDPSAPLLWVGDHPDSKQNVHYLHGALHLFETGDTVEKLTSKNGGRKILDQVTGEIRSGRFPLFVTEGKSKHKLTKMKVSRYLENSYRKFRRIVREESSVLFVFGHSLSDQDDHILRQIATGSFKHMFVSVREAPGGDAQNVISRARKLAEQRKRQTLSVRYFSADSANIWGRT